MPADAEEIRAALAEGVILQELTAPECLLAEEGGVKSAVCFKVKLGEPEADGRAKPVKIEGSQFAIETDSMITAIGQQADLDFFPQKELRTDPQTGETQIRNVFAGGDAVRGAASLIQAIADGKRAAEAMKQKIGISGDLSAETFEKGERDVIELQLGQARRGYAVKATETPGDPRRDFALTTRTLEPDAARKEASRCLECDRFCGICVTVCPNRANVCYGVEPGVWTVQQAIQEAEGIRFENTGVIRIRQPHQIIHIGDFCNECGNCVTFCPTNGAPFRTKPRFCLSEAAFAAVHTGYRWQEGVLFSKTDGKVEILSPGLVGLSFESAAVKATLDENTLTAMAVQFKSEQVLRADLRGMTEMGILYKALKNFYLFK